MSDEHTLEYYDYFWSSFLRKGHGSKSHELVKCVYAEIMETKTLVAKVLKDMANIKMENNNLRRKLLSMEREMVEQVRASAPRASLSDGPLPAKSKKRKSSSENVFQLASVDAQT